MNIEKRKNIHHSWNGFIVNNKEFDSLCRFVEKEKNLCPEKEYVFRFFCRDLYSIKYVILGMDPYPSTYNDLGKIKPVATGRSFEVANVNKWTDKYRQTSLANIFKAICYIKYGKVKNIEELRIDKEIKSSKLINIHEWFDEMERRGVLFLNASLTTTIGKSGAHINIWEEFMTNLIKYIVSNVDNVKWLVWGKNAQNRVTGLVDIKDIVYSCHPASRVSNDFVTNSGLDIIGRELI